jgi:hypothetical protein
MQPGRPARHPAGTLRKRGRRAPASAPANGERPAGDLSTTTVGIRPGCGQQAFFYSHRTEDEDERPSTAVHTAHTIRDARRHRIRAVTTAYSSCVHANMPCTIIATTGGLSCVPCGGTRKRNATHHQRVRQARARVHSPSAYVSLSCRSRLAPIKQEREPSSCKTPRHRERERERPRPDPWIVSDRAQTDRRDTVTQPTTNTHEES